MTSDSRKSIHLQTKKKSTHPVSPLDAKSAKRRRVSSTKHQLPTPAPSFSSSSSHEVDPKSSSKPTEIWGWTLSHDAIAPCFVKDVFALCSSETKGVRFSSNLTPFPLWNSWVQAWTFGGWAAFHVEQSFSSVSSLEYKFMRNVRSIVVRNFAI